MTLGERIAAFIWDRRWLLASICALLTLLAGWQAGRVGVDNSIRIWFVEDDPHLVSYRSFQKTFGNDEVAIVAFSRPEGFANGAGLALLRHAESALARVDGVAGVLSLAGYVDAWLEYETVAAAASGSIRSMPDDEEIRRRILGDPLLLDRLVSRDGATAALVARMRAGEDADARRDAILAQIDAVLAELAVPHHKAGIGVLYAALNRLSMVDAFALFCGAFALMFLVLWALYRRLAQAFVTLGVAGTATVWTMGLYGAAGRDLNMVTSVMPSVILVVGVAEAVHVLLHAAAVPEQADRRAKVVAAVGFMLPPCMLTLATSAAGFAALATSPLPAVRDLGIFTAAGLLFCLVLTLVACTFALAWAGCEPEMRRRNALAAVAERLCRVGIRHPVATLAFCALVAAGAIAASTRIVVDTFTLEFLFPDHPVRRDSEFIEARLGPYVPMEFIVRSADGAVRRELLDAIGRWQRDVRDTPGVGWSRSVVDLLKRDPRGVPDDAPGIDARIAEQRDASAARGDPMIDAAGGLRVTFSVRMQSSNDVARTTAGILALAHLPPGVTVSAAGYLPLYVRMVDYVVESQINGFAFAFATIFGAIALAFRSLRLAVLAIPSNLLPLLVILATMGLAGIRLDPATATIASVVLGLVVDDTVHFLHRLREDLGRNPDPEAALLETVRSAGQAILTTSLVMTLGFSLFVLAEIKSVVSFGLLIALAMVSSVITDLLIVPALVMLLSSVRRRAYRSV